jgi:uncharacterized repeat protein (TIGR01451 family)
MTRLYLFCFLTILGVLSPLTSPIWVTPPPGQAAAVSTLKLQSWSASDPTNSISRTGAITNTTEGELQAQDDPSGDFLYYFPLILKSFDPTGDWHILGIDKTATPSRVEPGGLLTYTISYRAYGNEPAPDLTLVDTVPPSTTFQSCDGGLICYFSGSAVIWTLGDAAPNTDGVVTMVVQVDNSAVSGTVLYNTVTLSDTSGLRVTSEISTPVGYDDPGGANPVIMVQDELGDFREPAGGQFTVSVNDHSADTDYILHFTNGGFEQTISFRTDSLGGKLMTVIISVSAPATASDPDYKIYTSEAGDASQTPVATCLGDGATNAPCFSVTSGSSSSPIITARNVDDAGRDQKPQPLNIDPARWPISSSLPIYVFGHNPSSSYRIMFDDQLSTAAPGSLWFKGTSVTQIPTDASFGFNQDYEPGYYIATGYSPGVRLTIASNDGSSDIATTEVDLIEAGIDIQGETPPITTTHPQDDVIGVVIRDLAPQQQYQVFVDDGISPSQIFRANDNGEISFSYRVPYDSHTPGQDPRPIEFYAVDYGRGPNPNKIVSRMIWFYTPEAPYLNIPGGGVWPAGSPLTIQFRRHLPDTDYEIYIRQGPADNPTFSELIAEVRTFSNPNNGLGEYDLNYTIPLTYSGSYTVSSYLKSAPNISVAEIKIEVLPAD